MKIKKGDTVLVIAGKNRGKTGKVAAVNSLRASVKVTGVNVAKRHLKATKGQTGGITEIVVPLPVSKVMLLCAHCNKPARIGYKFTSAGNKERICKICKSTV